MLGVVGVDLGCGGQARVPDPPERHRHTSGKDGWEQEGVVRV